MSDIASAPAEQTMWQAVLFQAFIDATRHNPYAPENKRSISSADRWIRGKGRDFCEVCALAGMDPDFLHDAYVQGRVDANKLRAAERSHKQVAA